MDARALEALFPGSRRILMGAMFTEPDRCWTAAELSGRAGVQPSTLAHYLAVLRDAGVLLQRHQNGRTIFQPNKECLIFTELQAIVTKLTSSGTETILVVEDQEATAQITRILLESWGYRVLEAHSGYEAIGMAASHLGAIHLLLTDIAMPGLTGPQVAHELLRRDATLRVVYMSGSHPDELPGHSNIAFLPKPFNPASLSQVIRKTLDRTVTLAHAD